MNTTQLNVLTDVDTNTGYIAFISETAKKQWTKRKTGMLTGIKFHGRDVLEMAELCIEQGYVFQPKNGRFTLAVHDETKADEIIAFIENQKPDVWVAPFRMYDNSYDRFLENVNTKKTGYFAFEGAIVVDFKKGLYPIFQTEKGIECWRSATPLAEYELYDKTCIQRFTLTEDTKYVFQDPSTLHEEVEMAFSLPKGEYEIEIGFDGDEQVEMFRIVRTDDNLQTNDDRSLLNGVQELLAKRNVVADDDVCQEIIQYIQQHPRQN